MEQIISQSKKKKLEAKRLCRKMNWEHIFLDFELKNKTWDYLKLKQAIDKVNPEIIFIPSLLMIILNIKIQTFYSMILSTVQVNFQFGHIKFIHLISQTPLLILLIKLKKSRTY